METPKKFDYIVIGGGSGGVASARRAATHGASVCLIEKGQENGGAGLGGTCVNMGCVPKKVMYNAASHAEYFESARGYTFESIHPSLDWGNLKKKRDAYLQRLNQIYATNLEKANIQVIRGTATFCGDQLVQVNGEKLTADHILIAVGGSPKMPEIPGIEHAITSDGFFHLEQQPRKVAIIGSGYIGVELAGIFNSLGTSTTIFCRKDHVLSNFDPMIKETLSDQMEKSGITIVRHSHLQRIEKENSVCNLHVEVQGKAEIFNGFDTVLVAVGREPVTGSLGLNNTGVKTDENGFIVVDEYENTSRQGIYAVGDATTTGWELTPVAIAAGRRLADRLFYGEKRAKINYKEIPTVVFSHPPLGTIGYTEPEAEKEFGKENLHVYKSEFTNLFFALSEKKQKTAMKLICVGESERIVGLHVIGMGADEMMQGFGVAIKMGATKQDFDNCVAIHPTSSEEFVTMAPWGMANGKPYLHPSIL